MVKSFVSSKELRRTLVFAKVTQFQNWQNDEYTEWGKQRNQVIFLVLVPMNLLWVTHYTRLLFWAWFAVGGQRTARAQAGAFEHHCWEWWKLRLELQSCWVMGKEEEMSFSAVFFSSVFHTFYSIDWQNMVLRERHTASIDHSFSGSPGWRSCFPTFSLLSSRKHGSKREGNDMEKGERAHADVEPWGEACGQH